MKVVFATANSQVWSGGVPVSIAIGQHWPANDPVVLAYPSMFADDPRYGLACSVPPVHEQAQVVESVTASPGEQRDVKRAGEPAEAEAARLRAHLEHLGVRPDGRWSLTRLREEAAKAEDAA